MQAPASLFEELLSSLIPVLVVVDALGMLRIVLSLTECMDKREECSAVHNAHYPWSWPGLCRLGQTCLCSIGDIAAALLIGWLAHFAALGCQKSLHGRASRDTQLSTHGNHWGVPRICATGAWSSSAHYPPGLDWSIFYSSRGDCCSSSSWNSLAF